NLAEPRAGCRYGKNGRCHAALVHALQRQLWCPFKDRRDSRTDSRLIAAMFANVERRHHVMMDIDDPLRPSVLDQRARTESGYSGYKVSTGNAGSHDVLYFGKRVWAVPDSIA